MRALNSDLTSGERLLLGPGPSMVSPRVLRAMATPLVGHLDPVFLSMMSETREMLQALWATSSETTLAMSGTGSAGMETCFVNLIEPGDRVVVGVNGVFGERMCDVAARCGAEVVRVEAEWGRTIDPDAVKAALAQGKTKLVAVVHAETSTGVLQPLEEIARLAHEHGALCVADCVTSLGGTEVAIDAWGIDAAYSGTQKCLSAPPGLAPVTLGERALRALDARQRPVQSWYLDLRMIRNYWGEQRAYHHTAPISMMYALREALRLIHEEGLTARFARHSALSAALVSGLEAMGLELFAPAAYRAPMLLSVRIPKEIDDATVRKALLNEFHVEIGGGLGPIQGKVWRIGLMGESCRRDAIVTLLGALGSVLNRHGHRADVTAAFAAVDASLQAAGAH